MYNAFELLSKAYNSTLDPKKEILQLAFVRGCGHRTLEQKVIRAMFGLLEYLGDNLENTDDRNLASRKESKEMVELYKEANNGNKPSDMLPHI